MQYPPELITALKNKYLLLDTNVFIDAASRMSIYTDFFILLKKNGVTLASIDAVKYEFLQGAPNKEKYSEKTEFFDSIADTILPMTTRSFELIYRLITAYGIDGKAPSVADFALGSFLMQYGENIFLMTRDTTDFVQNVFSLPFMVNVPHGKGIHTYGIYQYDQI